MVIVDVETGKVVGRHRTVYAHGVLSDRLPTGEALGDKWALQHPKDWVDAVEESVPQAVAQAGIRASDIVGIGIDFTSCTLLPIDVDGMPLCLRDDYRRRPHSWPKLWKHHAAWKEASRLTEVARSRNEVFLSRCGGHISPEWALPKMLQVLEEDEQIWAAADRFVEAGDWMVFHLTGAFVRNAGGAGFKAMWHVRDGFPPSDYLRAVHPQLAHLAATKLRGPVVPVGARAGRLAPSVAKRLGLPAGIPVATAVIDAFAAVPGLGVTAAGQLALAMGTSTCHMLLASHEVLVEGITGVVRDGIVPGYFGYEAGQAAVGDIFAWYAKSVPVDVVRAADGAGVSIFTWLEREAARLAPGESGLIALDWWNGNRSVLADTQLSGAVLGYSLATTPAEVYRALMEATAFGTRRIVEQFEAANLPVQTLHIGGGIAQKNAFLMQLYADITGRKVYVPSESENVAVGAAIFGAMVAGREHGGYDTFAEAVESMTSGHPGAVYSPNPAHRATYDKLYQVYLTLHDDLGRDRAYLMHELRHLREAAKAPIGDCAGE